MTRAFGPRPHCALVSVPARAQRPEPPGDAEARVAIRGAGPAALLTVGHAAVDGPTRSAGDAAGAFTLGAAGSGGSSLAKRWVVQGHGGGAPGRPPSRVARWGAETRATIRTVVWLVVVWGVLAVRAEAAQPAAPDTLVADAEVSLALRQRTFDVVWTTVRDRVYDPALVGATWDSVRVAFRPRVAGAATNDAFHLLLSEMLAELERSHFRVDPPHRAERFEASAAPRGAVDPRTGLLLDVVEGAVVVTDVASGSAGEAAGVRPGDVVRAVDGRDAAELREASRRLVPAIGHMGETFLATRATLQALVGDAGEPVRLSLDTPLGRRDVEVVRSPDRASTAVSWRRVGDVGVVRIPLFFHDTAATFRAALDTLRDTRGLVIDLRGTPGGLGDVLPHVAGALHRRGGSLGTIRQREPATPRVRSHRFHFHGRRDAYTRPVVVLVDGASASSAEVLAAGLQATGRALVVGRRTVGAVLPMGQVALPTAGMLRLPVAEYRPPDGRVLEGVGVVPDVVVSRTIMALQAGRDEDLEAALQLISAEATVVPSNQGDALGGSGRRR